VVVDFSEKAPKVHNYASAYIVHMMMYTKLSVMVNFYSYGKTNYLDIVDNKINFWESKFFSLTKPWYEKNVERLVDQPVAPKRILEGFGIFLSKESGFDLAQQQIGGLGQTVITGVERRRQFYSTSRTITEDSLLDEQDSQALQAIDDEYIDHDDD